MNAKKLWILGSAVLLALLFFGVVMGFSMTMVTLNARYSPNFVWFPFAAAAALIGASYWAEKRWQIGFSQPSNVPWGRIYIIGIALTILGVCSAVVQGSYTGMVRQTEVFDAPVRPLFQVGYAFGMSVLAAVLAEVSFRGIMQTRMQTVLSLWPTVIIIAVINVLAHRWGPELTMNWFGLLVTLAGWTYLRWLANSLWPPLILHGVTNFIVAGALWYRGPFVHADLPGATVALVALAGLAGLVVSIFLARDLHQAQPTAPAPASA